MKADVADLDTRFLVDPLSMIDAALVEVTSLRSILGAVQNRFESNIHTQDTGVVNLSAARERIEATDYAMETANYTQASILQQAGISVLAQVNSQPKNILPLLQQLG
ncbi:flagellin [Streptomyces xanthochromogenes]|uniref:flagellin n=1 Tax=Streptomyces xanthochromogenes TaxID=67384 RepID=UPI001E63ADB1|nr:flagellin [Streptomyces xanthochromogenes]